MARTEKMDKASVKNGRAKSSGETYNANHNTLEATRLNQAHIDPQRMRDNVYAQFNEDGKVKTIQGGKGGFDARAHELRMYEHYYSKGLEARNARYTAEGHKERCQSMADLYTGKKTAPLETIFQVGSKKSVIDKKTRCEALKKAWRGTMLEYMKKYGENFVPVDMALHCDEAENHIHNRVMLMAMDKYGHLVPNQTAALEAMGFERPHPDQPRGRNNNALMSFTADLRETFYRHCEMQGIQIDREVENHSKLQVSVLEYKCEQMREEARQAALEARAASQALSKTLGDIKTLNERIGALERSQAALRADNKHLSEENNKLKDENKALKSENKELDNQAFRMEMEIQALKKEKAKAEAEKEQARKDKAAALEKLEQIEKHQQGLFRQFQSRQVRTYGELAAEPEKKSWGGKVTQEAKPKRTIVATEDLERIQEQAKYSVLVDYNRATMAALDEKISRDDIIQGLQAQVKEQETEISRLNQLTDKQHLTIQDHRFFLQQRGLEQAFDNQHQTHSQSHHHHR